MINLLQERLKAGLVIFDGAVGTEIYRRNFFVNASYEQLNLIRKEVILDIHKQYIASGAEVLTTNTFNANARRLGKFGIADQTAEINRAGVAIALALLWRFITYYPYLFIGVFIVPKWINKHFGSKKKKS